MFHRFFCVFVVTMLVPGCTNSTDQQSLDSVTAGLTARIGTYKSTDELSRVLKTAGFSISSSTAEILLRTPLAKEETTLEFVVVTMQELGFGRYGVATTQEVYSSARRLGMVLCPAEAGPALRLRYRNLPIGNWFRLGMEPITSSDGIPRLFHMGHDGRDGEIFETLDAAPGRGWNHMSLWIFARNNAL